MRTDKVRETDRPAKRTYEAAWKPAACAAQVHVRIRWASAGEIVDAVLRRAAEQRYDVGDRRKHGRQRQVVAADGYDEHVVGSDALGDDPILSQ